MTHIPDIFINYWFLNLFDFHPSIIIIISYNMSFVTHAILVILSFTSILSDEPIKDINNLREGKESKIVSVGDGSRTPRREIGQSCRRDEECLSTACWNNQCCFHGGSNCGFFRQACCAGLVCYQNTCIARSIAARVGK